MKVEHPYLLVGAVGAFLLYVMYRRSVNAAAQTPVSSDLYGPFGGGTASSSSSSSGTPTDSAAIPNIVVTPNNVGGSSS